LLYSTSKGGCMWCVLVVSVADPNLFQWINSSIQCAIWSFKSQCFRLRIVCLCTGLWERQEWCRLWLLELFRCWKKEKF